MIIQAGNKSTDHQKERTGDCSAHLYLLLSADVNGKKKERTRADTLDFFHNSLCCVCYKHSIQVV